MTTRPFWRGARAFAEARIAPRVDMEIASNETIKQAVAAGFGLGFLSAHAVQQELTLGSLAVVPVKGFPVMRLWYVVQLRGRRLPRVAQAFREFLAGEGERLIRRITANWESKQPEIGTTQLKFVINRDGTFSKPELEISSGSVLLDLKARAAFDRLRIDPLPRAYSEDKLTIHLRFPYVR